MVKRRIHLDISRPTEFAEILRKCVAAMTPGAGGFRLQGGVYLVVGPHILETELSVTVQPPSHLLELACKHIVYVEVAAGNVVLTGDYKRLGATASVRKAGPGVYGIEVSGSDIRQVTHLCDMIIGGNAESLRTSRKP